MKRHNIKLFLPTWRYYIVYRAKTKRISYSITFRGIKNLDQRNFRIQSHTSASRTKLRLSHTTECTVLFIIHPVC